MLLDKPHTELRLCVRRLFSHLCHSRAPRTSNKSVRGQMSRHPGDENPAELCSADRAFCGLRPLVSKCSKAADLTLSSDVCATRSGLKKGRIAMRGVCGAIVLLCLGPASVLGKEKVMTLSWGDVIWQHRGQGVAQIDTPEKIRESLPVRSSGVWRCEAGARSSSALDPKTRSHL